MKKIYILLFMALCTLGMSAQDYSIKVGSGTKSDVKYTDGSYGSRQTVTITKGADVAKVQYVIFSSKVTAIETNATKIANGSYSTVKTLTTETSAQLTFSTSGKRTAIFITLDSEGKYTGNYTSIDINFSVPTDWKDAGTVQYTDGFMGNYNKTVDGLTWPVKIQSIDAIPGYYRLVTPYGEDCTLVKKYSNFTADGTTQYMYIDATEPNKVFIENYHKSGMNAKSGEDEGPVYMSSKAGYKISRGDVVDSSTYGTYDVAKGTITFPKDALYYCWSKDGKISWNSSNKNGNFKIAFPISANMTIGDAKWGTFFAPFDVTLPEGAFAYTINVEGNKTVRNKVAEGGETIPANTAVLVYSATAIDEDFEGTYSSVVPDLANALVGTLEPIASGAAPTGAYYLAKKNDVLNFYPAGQAKLAANRAYLVVPEGAKIEGLFEGEVTGINEVNAKNADSILRNIQGMPVNKGYKGIVIMDGKKYLKK